MNLKEKLQTELASMAQFSTGEQLLELDAGAQALRCELAALDSLACAFNLLAVRSETLAGKSIGELKATAEGLSRRLTYLLEPISPIEIDAEGCVVQMRSNPPQKEADRTSYYELLVARSGQLSLGRYERAAGQSRVRIPAQVTREVLLRLVGDFSAAAQ